MILYFNLQYFIACPPPKKKNPLSPNFKHMIMWALKWHALINIDRRICGVSKFKVSCPVGKYASQHHMNLDHNESTKL